MQRTTGDGESEQQTAVVRRGQLLFWRSMGGMGFMYRNAGVNLVLK